MLNVAPLDANDESNVTLVIVNGSCAEPVKVGLLNVAVEKSVPLKLHCSNVVLPKLVASNVLALSNDVLLNLVAPPDKSALLKFVLVIDALSITKAVHELPEKSTPSRK